MEDVTSIPWNNRLRNERIWRNWRQQDLADELGTSVSTIQRWERGSQQPSAYFRIKLCALFGKSAQELGVLDTRLFGKGAEELRLGEEAANDGSDGPVQRFHEDTSISLLIQDSPQRDRGKRSVAGDTLPIQPTSLIGREREIALVKQLLCREDIRPLTLTGPGGTGKTWLGVQVAHQLRNIFADGVFL